MAICRINKRLEVSMTTMILIALVFYQDALQSIEEDENIVLIVGTEPTFPPFEITDEAGNIIGFDIDLITAIAEDQGFTVKIQSVGFDALIPAVRGNIDVIASGMTITEAREEEVDFSEPYIDAGLTIAVAADNDEITGIETLDGKIAAVQIESTGTSKANELLDEGNW